ncbi:MAG: NAD(P)-dependent oxidoreductase [Eubacterium limosum]|nr:NAD(P)-dependent oxidoreductase [Eubacterium limosum]
MKKAIITGATGAVGMALIQELIKQNIEILVLCREGSKRKQQIPKHPLVTIKYCALDQLEKVENDTNQSYDVFYHFAWSGTTGVDRDDMYMQNLNIKYALDAVKAAKKFGCQTFIGAGSQAEYGRVEGVLKPDTPTFPENGYGMAKLCAGQMTRELAYQLGIKHIWVRILSVYGPYDGAQSMVMSTIKKLKEGIVPEFTKGEQMWDYLFSEDAARAFYLLGIRGKDRKTYVLGSGTVRPLGEYIEEIQKAVGNNIEIKLGAIPYQPKQVMYLCADISELKKDVNFEILIDFNEGLSKILKIL